MTRPVRSVSGWRGQIREHPLRAYFIGAHAVVVDAHSVMAVDARVRVETAAKTRSWPSAWSCLIPGRLAQIEEAAMPDPLEQAPFVNPRADALHENPA